MKSTSAPAVDEIPRNAVDYEVGIVLYIWCFCENCAYLSPAHAAGIFKLLVSTNIDNVSCEQV